MAGAHRQRPSLAPARHAAIDQPEISPCAIYRPQAQALHDTRAEALDEAVRRLDQTQHRLDSRRLLEVEDDRVPAAIENVEPAAAARASTRSMRRTSAPMSASIIAAKGAAPSPANSTILIPCNGPMSLRP